MKIYLPQYPDHPEIFFALLRRFKQEGCTTVLNSSEADLVTDSSGFTIHGYHPNIFNFEFQPAASPKHEYQVTKYFKGNFHDQTLVGFPLWGLMDQNKGAPVEAGLVTKSMYISELEDLFLNKELLTFLDQSSFHGFVTFSFWLDKDRFHLSRLEFGIPYMGIFNFLECVRGPISEFIISPSPDYIHESWVCNLHLSRHPWPCLHHDSLLEILNLGSNIEKHFWHFDLDQVPGTQDFRTEATLIGCATSWNADLAKACSLAETTCKVLHLPHAQFRTDSFTDTTHKLNRLERFFGGIPNVSEPNHSSDQSGEKA